MKQTAMQELIEDITIEKRLGYITENAASRILEYINNLYFKKEKEQIKRAFENGGKYPYDVGINHAEQYYNQTYNQNK